jgi:hypothetical protein
MAKDSEVSRIARFAFIKDLAIIFTEFPEEADMKIFLWFVLIMTLGNIAMAGYLLMQLRHLCSGENLDRLFSRKVSP